MNPDQHRKQVERVQAAERLPAVRKDRHDVYARHPLARAVPQGEPTIGSLSQSIRELGEMMVAADQYPVFAERLAELERLAGRTGTCLATLRGLIDAEFADCMGAS